MSECRHYLGLGSLFVQPPQRLGVHLPRHNLCSVHFRSSHVPDGLPRAPPAQQTLHTRGRFGGCGAGMYIPCWDMHGPAAAAPPAYSRNTPHLFDLGAAAQKMHRVVRVPRTLLQPVEEDFEAFKRYRARIQPCLPRPGCARVSRRRRGLPLLFSRQRQGRGRGRLHHSLDLGGRGEAQLRKPSHLILLVCSCGGCAMRRDGKGRASGGVTSARARLASARARLTPAAAGPHQHAQALPGGPHQHTQALPADRICCQL